MKEPMRRLVTGFLAASMALSLLPFGGATATTTSSKTAESGSRPVQELGSDAILASKDMGSGEIAMPLVLDKSQLGFYDGQLEQEVTAYMTDLQYLGGGDGLTFEEYASFFPAWVDLDKVDYLTYQQKQALKNIPEEKRLAHRAAAEAKLDLQEQFVWEAAMDGEDYSDQITFEPKSWIIYEATQDSAPMLACTAVIRWSGKVPTVSVAADSNEINQLLDQANQSSGENTGTKSIADESPEVQEFLWELYKSGLVQSNSPYDLSVFEERAKAEGLTISESETGVDLDKLLNDIHNSTGEEGEPTEGEGTTPVDTGFNMLTGNGSDPTQSQENADQTQGTQAGTDGAVEEDGGDSADGANKETAQEGDQEPAASENGDNTTTNNSGEDVQDQTTAPEQTAAPENGENEADKDAEANGDQEDGEVTVPETQVPQAPEPGVGGEGADPVVRAETAADPEESETPTPETTPAPEEDGENGAESGNMLPEGTEIAYYTVSMKSDDRIRTYGAAICLASSVPQTVAQDPEEQDPDENKQDDEPETPGEKVPTMEEKMAEITATFNGQSQGPDVANGRIYHIRSFAEKRVNGVLVPETYDDIVPVMQRLLADQNTGLTLRSIDVLDHRVAEFDPESQKLIMRGEGQTVVYASATNNLGDVYFAVAQLDVRGIYHLSSENASEPDPKAAVPMISAGQNHTLALTSEGKVYGWGDGGTGALGAQNEAQKKSPVPVTMKQPDGTFETMSGIVAVAAGSGFSLALTKDGTVYAWGSYTYGQLGTTEEVSEGYNGEPALVLGPRDTTDTANRDSDNHLCNIVAISAGVTHSLALAKDGTVYAWGRAGVGQLGQGVDLPEGTTYITTPVAVIEGTKDQGASGNRLGGIIAIVAGSDFSLALSSTGRVFSWGDNRRGQLGTNDPTGVSNRNYAVLVQESKAYGETTGDPKPFDKVLALSGWGANVGSGVQSSGHAMAITAVTDEAGSLTGETKAWGWGDNSQSETGTGIKDSDQTVWLPCGVGFKESYADEGLRIVGIAAGAMHSLAIVRLNSGNNDGAETVQQTALMMAIRPQETETTTETPEPEETESSPATSPAPEETETVSPEPEETETPDETPAPEESETPDETPAPEESEEAPVTPAPEESETAPITPDPEDTGDGEEDTAKGTEEQPPEAGAQTQEDVTNDVDIAAQALEENVTTDVNTEDESENDSVTTENDTKGPEDAAGAGEAEDGTQDQDPLDKVENEKTETSEDNTETSGQDENTEDVNGSDDEKQSENEKNDGESNGENSDSADADAEQQPTLQPEESDALEANGINALTADEGEQDPTETPASYDYFVYVWGLNNHGNLGRPDHSDAQGTVEFPIRMYLTEPEVSEEGETIAENPVKNPGGITAGNAFSVYWYYDGTVDSLENGTVMATGWNSTGQLGAEEALRELYPDQVELPGSYPLPIRVGAGVGKQLIFNKVWVFTDEEDPDTGIVTRKLTARYAEQPARVTEEDVDRAILADIGQENMDLSLLPVNKLSDFLTITDRQDLLVFKSGIRRYYSVGFNVFERDRSVATPEGVEIDYDVDPKPDELEHLNLIVTTDTDVSGENNAKMLPTGETKEERYGTNWFDAQENLPPEDRYVGGFYVEVKDADNFTTPSIQAGAGFMVALKSDGSVWAWGDNAKGQLGMGATSDQVPYTTYPTPVAGLMGNGRLNLISEISVGYEHVLARSADGSVYAWGSNEFGQLGQGETFVDTYSCVPLQVIAGDSEMFNEGAAYLSGATMVAAGGYHNLALLGNSDGFVYSWGSNNLGQLGTGKLAGEEIMRNYPSQVIYNSGAILPQERYLTNTSIIAAGGYHSLAVGIYQSKEGEVVSTATSMLGWGWNEYGQLGRVTQIQDDGQYYELLPSFAQYGTVSENSRVSGVRKVVAGERHTVALCGEAYTGQAGGNRTNRVRVMGDTSYGQCGNVTEWSVANLTFATDLLETSIEDGGVSDPVMDGIDVAAGRFYTVVLRGEVAAPKEEGGEPVVLNSTVYAFGSNDSGQLGQPSDALSQSKGMVEIKIDGLGEKEVVTKVAAAGGLNIGATKTASVGGFGGALTNENQIYTWGKNDKGQLGDFTLLDRSAPVKVGFEEAWLPRAAGVINFGGDLDYSVTIRVEQDHVVYPENGRNYRLVLNTPVATVVDLIPEMKDGEPTGYYHTAEDKMAKGGSYSIWATVPDAKDEEGNPVIEWEDTLADVEVGKGRDFTTDPAIVDFFTIRYNVDEVGALDSKVSAVYDGEPVQNGDVVWGNGKLEITVAGHGGLLDNYGYNWSDNVPGGSKNEYTTTEVQREGKDENGQDIRQGVVNGVLTVENLTDTFNMTCTVTGPTGHDVTVEIRKDGGSWINSGKTIQLVSNFGEYTLRDDGTGTFINDAGTKVASGIYSIVDDAYNTGRTIDVGNTNDISLDYYTLTYSVTPRDGMIWAYVEAFYADSKKLPILTQELPSGKPVLEGAEIVLRTEARNFTSLIEKNNRYDWAATGDIKLESTSISTSGQTGYAVYTMGSQVSEVFCDVYNQMASGRGVDIIRVTLDGAIWADAGNELTVTLESNRGRGEKVTEGKNAVWASYPLGYTEGGVFNGTVPADGNEPNYRVYINGGELPGILVAVNGNNTQITNVPFYTLTYQLSLDDTAGNTATGATLRVETVNLDDPTGTPILHQVTTVDTTNPEATNVVAHFPYVDNSKWTGALRLSLMGEGAATYNYTWGIAPPTVIGMEYSVPNGQASIAGTDAATSTPIPAMMRAGRF